MCFWDTGAALYPNTALQCLHQILDQTGLLGPNQVEGEAQRWMSVRLRAQMATR